MLASLGWTQWPFLHCFQERQLQISQQLRDKTQVCCFSVENPRASRGTCVPLPPRLTAGSTGTCRALPALLLALPRCWRNNLKAGPQAPAPCSWFSLHGSILLLPTICVFQHLPTHRSLGLPVFGQETEIQHLSKLSQSLRELKLHRFKQEARHSYVHNASWRMVAN